MPIRTNKYWQNRAAARMVSYQRKATSTILTITRAYDKAILDIENEVQKIFNRFATDGNLTSLEAKQLLNQAISRTEWQAIKSKIGSIQDPVIKRQLLNQLNAPAYAARITRLEALKANTLIQSRVIADAEIRLSTKGYIETINDAYYRSMFDIQKGIGLRFDFTNMPTRTVEGILKNPWSGEQFSKRVWHNTDVLAAKLDEVITSGFMSGAGVREMAKELEEMSDLGKYAANRLVRTEVTYMANAAEMESYKEADIDKYQFLATLDMRTSKECQKLDLQIFNVKDAKPGKNMPPMHPHCRSTTIAHFDDDTMADIGRRARDPETGKNVIIPGDMTYSQWRESMESKHGENRIEVIEKKIRNRATDKEQHQRYKLIYGDKIPSKLDDFQEMKYNKIEEWEEIKANKQQTLNSLDYRDSFFGKFGNKETREWYVAHDRDIPNLLNTSKSLEQQAKQAHALRNKYRTQARDMMKDQELRRELDIDRPNPSFEDLVEHKRKKYGFTREEALEHIIMTASTTNKAVNESLGVE